MLALLLSKRVPTLVMRNVRLSSGLTTEQVNRTQSLMKRLSLFVVPLVVGMAAVNAYQLEMEHKSHPRKEYIAYPYLNIKTRPWPWGDGRRSLFHNPKTNYIKDEGYEEEW